MGYINPEFAFEKQPEMVNDEKNNDLLLRCIRKNNHLKVGSYDNFRKAVSRTTRDWQ